MKPSFIIASIVFLGLFSGNLHAKPGKIVKGENGTKWCCPDGKKGDGCEKGASSTPVGALCNFASRQVVLDPSIKHTGTDAPDAKPQENKSAVKANVPTPN